jgi:hypothetical protein
MDRQRLSVSTMVTSAALGATLVFGGAVALSAQSTVNVVDLIGKSRAEIATVFPGTTMMLTRWRGWQAAWIVPDRNGRFLGLILSPRTPLSELDAEDAVRALGISVERRHYFAGPTEHGYSDMAGPIRTVIYDLDSTGLVTGIRIHAALADVAR